MCQLVYLFEKNEGRKENQRDQKLLWFCDDDASSGFSPGGSGEEEEKEKWSRKSSKFLFGFLRF